MKKALSLIFAFVLIFSAVQPTVYADGTQLITGIEVNVDTDSMIGLTPADYEQFIEVVTPGLEIRQDEFVGNKNNGTENPYIDVYTYGDGVWSTLYLYPIEGFSLPADIQGLTDGVKVRRKILEENDVNSRKPECKIHSSDGINGDYIEITFSYAPTGPIKLIRSVDISFDSEIAGKTPDRFMEFFTLNTDGLEIRQDSFDAWYQISGSVNMARADVFELGEVYHSKIYVYPKEGYAISGLVYNLPVTLEPISDKEGNIISYMEYNTYRQNEYLVSGLEISFTFRVTGPDPEPTGAAKLFAPIINFFNSIVVFITEKIIQPIMDLFI